MNDYFGLTQQMYKHDISHTARVCSKDDVWLWGHRRLGCNSFASRCSLDKYLQLLKRVFRGMFDINTFRMFTVTRNGVGPQLRQVRKLLNTFIKPPLSY